MKSQLGKIIILISILFVGGSLGYFLIEGWSYLDSFYMTVITLSTTGYKEVYPLSPSGRVLTMVLIVLGISVLFYALRELNLFIFEGNFFWERKMQKQLNQLHDHYIICGFGRMGKKIVQELEKRNEPYVVIENDTEMFDPNQELMILQGDATEDDDLLKAGIKKAKGLVSVLSTDIANTFTTLSARGLNPDLKIIARAEEESSKGKLIKAGANRVILPYEIGGFRIMQALLKPTVVDYIDEVFSRSDIGLEIEEIKIMEGSKLIGKTISESQIRSSFNTIIVGIYRADSQLTYNPRPDITLESQDNLIVIGEHEKLEQLQDIANAK
jgi:voltage-gated potassium channel